MSASNDNTITPEPTPREDDKRDAITPLEGEPGLPSVMQPKPSTLSVKGILVVALLVLTIGATAGLSIHRALSSGAKDPDADPKRGGSRPIAASSEPHKLDLTPAPTARSAAASSPAGPAIPAIEPIAEDAQPEPIGVRRTGQTTGRQSSAKTVSPEDAPVLLVSSRRAIVASGPDRASTGSQEPGTPDDGTAMHDPLDETKHNLERYQRQLQTLLATLAKTSGETAASGVPIPHAGPPGGTATAPGAGLLGGQLQGSATPRVGASMLGNRSLTLPKGTIFTCALKTRVVSATSGFIGCQVQRNVYSDDGRVLLIERGSHMDGEYRATSIRPGTVRIPVLWTRVRTPNGVTVAIDSPGTGQLGESGIDGYVDNRWVERIGAAMLVSLINDAVQLVIQTQTSDSNSDTILLPSTTSSTSKLAEKVLDSTINIPPLIYNNQGGIVGIYVARDVDFSPVYELQAVAR